MRVIFIYILSLLLLSGCYETKRQSYSERRGLMLLEKHEYARNQGVYKPSKKRKKNVSKKIKKLQSGSKKNKAKISYLE